MLWLSAPLSFCVSASLSWSRDGSGPVLRLPPSASSTGSLALNCSADSARRSHTRSLPTRGLTRVSAARSRSHSQPRDGEGGGEDDDGGKEKDRERRRSKEHRRRRDRSDRPG